MNEQIEELRERKTQFKVELNSRQWALYDYLKYLYNKDENKWHNLKSLCLALYSFEEYTFEKNAFFNNTAARRRITDDLNILANSDIIKRVVLSTSKGIKLANSDEVLKELDKKKISILKEINRLNKQYKKSSLNGQYRLVFGQEKEVIEAF